MKKLMIIALLLLLSPNTEAQTQDETEWFGPPVKWRVWTSPPKGPDRPVAVSPAGGTIPSGTGDWVCGYSPQIIKKYPVENYGVAMVTISCGLPSGHTVVTSAICGFVLNMAKSAKSVLSANDMALLTVSSPGSPKPMLSLGVACRTIGGTW